jgi:hypothetical protein
MTTGKLVLLDNIVDPNVLGELIRHLAFETADRTELGAYSCFTLRRGWEPLKKHGASWDEQLQELIAPYSEGKPIVYYCNEDGTMVVGWWWDEDGVLIVAYPDPATLELVAALNTDCKNTRGWEWV